MALYFCKVLKFKVFLNDFFEWYSEKTHCKLICVSLEALMISIERAQKDEIFILNYFPSSSGKVISRYPTQLSAFLIEGFHTCESVSWFCCPVLCLILSV